MRTAASGLSVDGPALGRGDGGAHGQARASDHGAAPTARTGLHAAKAHALRLPPRPTQGSRISTAAVAGSKKKLADEQRTLVVIDETGLSVQPHVARQWAPRGQTPELRRHAGREHTSFLTALTVTPNRHYGMHFLGQREAFTALTCRAVVEELQRRLRRPLLVLWDNLRAHHAAERAFKATAPRPDRIDFAYFPPYSPWLDPAEFLFANIKSRRLAQFCPKSHDELDVVASRHFAQARRDPSLIRACFQHAQLNL